MRFPFVKTEGCSFLSDQKGTKESPGADSGERLRAAGAHSHLAPGPPFTGDALQKDLRTLPAGKDKIAGPSCPGDTGPYPVEI